MQPLGHLMDPLRFAASRDPEGQKWIAKLPTLVDLLCQRWGLERDQGPLRHGYNAVVILVLRDSEPLVLKLNWPALGVSEEVRGLEAWNGNGMVRMFAADERFGAVLLERLDADRALREVEAMDAVEIAGRLLRRLAIPAPPAFRNVRTLVASTARSLEAQKGRPDCPVPPQWLERAIQLARDLATRAGTDLLIHSDMHYDNILAAQREPWLAIDPRPVAGEPEQAIPELLWTRHDVESEEGVQQMLHVLVESAGLDIERTRSWVMVRCVDYWLWGLEHGLTQDPKRCQLILRSLLG